MMALHSLTMPGSAWGSRPKGVRVRVGDNPSKGLAHSLRPLACARVGALLMPKASARQLQPASCCFPHASPVSQTGAGKQNTAPQDRSNIIISLRKFVAGEGIRTLDPNLGKVISQNAFGADGGTRTRTLREKQIFLPLRLSPPPVGVRGLDCPFAMARPKAPPVQSLHLPSIEGLARDWPGARAR